MPIVPVSHSLRSDRDTRPFTCFLSYLSVLELAFFSDVINPSRMVHVPMCFFDFCFTENFLHILPFGVDAVVVLRVYQLNLMRLGRYQRLALGWTAVKGVCSSFIPCLFGDLSMQCTISLFMSYLILRDSVIPRSDERRVIPYLRL